MLSPMEMETTTHNPDIRAIRHVVAAIEHSQNNELADAFVGLFREDAVWTTGHGKRLFGREEISAFTRKVLPGAMSDSTATYEVLHVLFIRPDVAAVTVHAQYWTLGGEPLGNPGSPLYVMAKENNDWRLVACQNTEILA
ncbi:SgcJ/EcaC family oxidoreductase [Streptomyces sp. NPDC093109]|uniref:SgcJ/EcaC family oxidoreductase n=1 Tax=Streptomyces sp. NPDC093109 TaxID=3154977 RepID=UPI00344CEB63